MARRIQDAYIVAACRTPVGKARGAFATTRPDDLLAHVLRGALDRCPGLSADEIGDVVVGCAMPEAEQGLNVARMGLLLAGYPDSIPGVTVNRFCASGLQAVAWAADRIRLGEADVMVAGGTETMSLIPMGGHHVAMNPRIFERDVGIAFGMGTTAEKVAERYKVSRDDQDAFALESHRRAVAAIDAGEFEDESIAVNVEHRGPGDADGDPVVRRREVATDEGPRRDASLEALTRLRPVFAAGGSVTAGNSSQMSDGAAAIVLVSESRLRSLGLQPLARFVGFSVAGVAPEVMGIGPVEAIPRVLDQTGLTRKDMDWIELNEAFAAQSLAVIRSLDLAADKVNPLGGAIALGHPLGATGAIRVATLVHGLRRRAFRYGMVTMCVGTGMGAAGIFELA